MDIGLHLLRKSGGKRGWQEGQGLGLHEQGPTEPLQPSIRVGNVGIGFELPPIKKKTAPVTTKKREIKAVVEEKPRSIIEHEAAHEEFQAIGRMLSAAFNDETDVPQPRRRIKGKGDTQPRSRITRTNPLIDD